MDCATVRALNTKCELMNLSSQQSSFLTRLAPILVVGAFFMAMCAGLIAMHADVGSWANDQNKHHLLTIEQFAEQMPWPNVVNYPSATAPGWHLFLAVIVKAGVPIDFIRWCALLPGLLLLIAVWRVGLQFVSPLLAAAASLPIALSPYTIGGSSWITTDVPALACVAWSIALLLNARTRGADALVDESPWHPRVIRASVMAALAVTIRQPAVWLAAPIAWSAMCRRLRWGYVSSILPIAVLLMWIALWRGLIPPAYRDMHDTGWNGSAILIYLALVCLWGCAFVWVIPPSRSELLRTLKHPIVRASLAIVLVLWIALPSNYSHEHGRWGGPIWSAIEKCPSLGDRSLLLLPLALAGVVVIAQLWKRACEMGRGMQANVIVMSLCLVAVSNGANSQAWERYADPYILLLVPWLALAGCPRDVAGWRVLLASMIPALAQVAIAWITIWRPFLTGLNDGGAT